MRIFAQSDSFLDLKGDISDPSTAEDYTEQWGETESSARHSGDFVWPSNEAVARVYSSDFQPWNYGAGQQASSTSAGRI